MRICYPTLDCIFPRPLEEPAVARARGSSSANPPLLVRGSRGDREEKDIMSTSTSASFFDDDDSDVRPTFFDFSSTQISELVYIAVRETEG